jgi:diguanylate cyclase (GGDEF)-like protein
MFTRQWKTRALEHSREAVRRRNRDLSTLRDAAEYDAMHDALTGLANRRALEKELELRHRRFMDQGDGLAVMQIDLDRFKEVNDTMGHAAGDAVLNHVGEVLRQALRGHDFIARVGGDEFVVLAKSGDREALEKVAGRLVEELGKPISFQDMHCPISASIGIDIMARCADDVAPDAGRLLANADIALYRAKDRGRRGYAFFTEKMRSEVEEARALGDDLVRGIEAGEFFPVYQPQVRTGSRSVHGVEALARWQHPTRGEIAPWIFLPIAEQVGMTEAIDAAILARALDDLVAWDAAGLHVPHLSVNVSARRLADPSLLRTLDALDIPQGRVSFEVLETVLTDRIDDALREKGIEIEVDDFGTGHASLLALMSLRPNRLKIARELVDPITKSEEHRAVLASVLEIARALDTEVTAEGVETEEHAVLLEGMGCHVMQGYYFARPMPRDAAAALMADMAKASQASAVA